MTMPAQFRRLALTIALRRLRRDRGYFRVSTITLACSLALCAVASAWLYVAELRPLPWPEPSSLWKVRVASARSVSIEGLGDSVQDYPEAAIEFVRRQRVFDNVGIASFPFLSLSDDAAPVRVMRADQAMVELIGLRAQDGRLPSPNRDEIAVSETWARQRFGSAHAALGGIIETRGGAYRITGVIQSSFVAPLPLSEQRVAGMRPTWFQLANEAEVANRENNDLLIIGRSQRSAAPLVWDAQPLLKALSAESALPDLILDLELVATSVRKEEAQLARMLLAAAALLWLTSAFGVIAATAVRMKLRTTEHFVSLAIGFDDGALTRIAALEVYLLMTAAATMALAAFLALVVLMQSNPMLVGMTGTPFLVAGACSIVGGTVLNALGLRYFSVPGAAKLQSLLASGAGNRRGADRSSGRERLFRLLASVQASVGLLAMLLTFSFAIHSMRSLAAIIDLHNDGLAEISIRRSPSVPPALFKEEIDALRRRLVRDERVQQAALSTSPALDLVGVIQQYSGPREGFGNLVAQQGSSRIYSSKGDSSSGGVASISYRVAAIDSEPQWFSMLGFDLERGRLFDAQEENAVLLTPDAQRVLFGNTEPLGERIPNGPRVDDFDRWHNGLRVAGVIDARRASDAGIVGRFMSGMPAVFTAFPTAGFDRHGIDNIFLLVQTRDASSSDWSWMASDLQVLRNAGLAPRLTLLGDELRRRLVDHLFVLALLLAVATMVVVGAAASALTTMTQLTWIRRGEIGIRIAIGEPEFKVGVRLAGRELAWPAGGAAVTALGLWMILPLLGDLASNGISDAHVALALLVLLLALLAGTTIAIASALKRSPSQVLGSET